MMNIVNDVDCKLCLQAECARAPALLDPKDAVVHEFKNSILFVGPHQRFPGYCMLVSKLHVREPFELPSPAREEMMAELLTSAQAIQAAFRPLKMNYGCYGNQVPHLHWHLFPRYETDPMKKEVPWMQSAEFSAAKTTENQARDVSNRIRSALRTLLQ